MDEVHGRGGESVAHGSINTNTIAELLQIAQPRADSSESVLKLLIEVSCKNHHARSFRCVMNQFGRMDFLAVSVEGLAAERWWLIVCTCLKYRISADMVVGAYEASETASSLALSLFSRVKVGVVGVAMSCATKQQ